MSVEKMKLVNIAGPIRKFEEIILKHIINNDVHLEDAQLVLESIHGLFPFMDENQYDNKLFSIEDLNKHFNVTTKKLSISKINDILGENQKAETLDAYIKTIQDRVNLHHSIIDESTSKIGEKQQVMNQMIPIMELDINIDNLFHFDYVKFRFGKLSSDNYRKLKRYIRDLDVILITNQVTEDTVWLSYFMPAIIAEKIDSIFASLFFERIRLAGGIEGTPKHVQEVLNMEINQLNLKIEKEQKEFDEFIRAEKSNFQKAFTEIHYLQRANEIKVYAGHTMESFYIVGWVPEKKAEEIKRALSSDLEMMYIEEDADDVKNTNPPTKLKNRKMIAPYEMLITMYGLPQYNTIDPTSFVAITYTVMFGIMFGDIGQGFLFLLAGIYFKFVKKKSFGLIVLNIGIFSMIFGFLYGSFFGNEEIIRPIWSSPLHSINTILYMSVGMGVFMILVAMVINIINKIRTKDYGQLFFSKNGIAGFVLYLGAILFILNFVITGKAIGSIVLIVLFFVLPIVAIFFEKQLSEKIVKVKKEHQEKHSFVEAFFELFEALLGFLSNTISFVRVGAFALNHAGLSLAVWTLYNMNTSAGGKVIVLIIGNLLIIGLEGLIVGIQCLRLQYYEMFSRFFSINGRKFVSQNIGEDN
ncbi:MAG: V-type ATP synthase subunit I [Clostridia bacterium]|nr:V-type ATP synthase subunit I [Clostridia bacterium]